MGFFGDVANFFTGNRDAEEKRQREAKARREEQARRDAQAKQDAEDQRRRNEAREREEARNRERISDLRSSELRETRAEEERADRQRQAALEKIQTTKTANYRREDEIGKSHQQERVKAMERAEEALKNQKDADRAEIMTREKINQEMLKQVQENKDKIEGNILENVEALKKKNTRFQEECHNEKKQLGIQVVETTKQNNDKILKEKETTNEIVLGNQQNQLDHDSRMYARKQEDTMTTVNVGFALDEDKKEAVFVADVRRMVDAGRALSGVIDSLAVHALKLTKGKKPSAMENDIGLCEIIINRINGNIVKLQASCLEISNHRINDHIMVELIQKSGLDIQECVEKIQDYLVHFQVSLTEDPNVNSKELFANLQTESKSLYKMIGSIPVVTETNRAVTCLRQHTETLALGTRMDRTSIAEKGNVQASLEDKK